MLASKSRGYRLSPAYTDAGQDPNVLLLCGPVQNLLRTDGLHLSAHCSFQDLSAFSTGDKCSEIKYNKISFQSPGGKL